jgi:hypothetical protein
MPKGAPKGNQYARKEHTKRWDSVTLYLDGYTMEFLQAACKNAGQEPTRANAKRRAKTLAREAIDQDMKITFTNLRLDVSLEKGKDSPMTIQYYTRPIDDGAGRQNLTIVDGIIQQQSIVALTGYDAGDGNPELVGLPTSSLRGMGFKKVAGPQSWNSFTNKWQSVNQDYALFDDAD